MPFKGRRRGRKPLPRKRRDRYGTRKQQLTLYNVGLNPIPERYITKMKYAEAVTVSASGIAGYKWNLNSLFDPNRSGIGHQPYGYDQLCGPAGSALYNRYRVISCKYILTVTSDSANIQFAALPANESLSLIGNVSEARENPKSQYATYNPGGIMRMLKGTVSLPKLIGRTKSQYMADDNYQAVYNASPSEVAILNCYAQGLNDDPTFNANPTFNILLEYTVEFFDRHTLDQS